MLLSTLTKAGLTHFRTSSTIGNFFPDDCFARQEFLIAIACHLHRRGCYQDSAKKIRRKAGLCSCQYIGLAEKVHKVNLGDRELMKSGFRHLAPDFRT
ncbi:hypothetical protein KR51_00004900 [Rubidibacter lacunae KORDI 51-2]|uniref:Uncharacterized protein n=1 Tax=Rubidibacter lacunae KORDI 51-2 TaxID=582515 RepID=U5DM70_9CHRO|nr:hypothetical protein KR51_00004900 [Rubidibacter lacunae KORDI 51-2]